MWINVLNVVCELNKTDDISMRLNNKKRRKKNEFEVVIVIVRRHNQMKMELFFPSPYIWGNLMVCSDTAF